MSFTWHEGVCYTVPLVGGRIADMAAGRFNTIFASFLILSVGNCLYSLAPPGIAMAPAAGFCFTDVNF